MEEAEEEVNKRSKQIDSGQEVCVYVCVFELCVCRCQSVWQMPADANVPYAIFLI